MPLTLPEYTDLWNNPMPAGFGQGGVPPQFPGVPFPNYVEYFDRDNQLEDYLDIFRGRNTRAGAGAVAGAVGRMPLFDGGNDAGWYYPHPFFPPPGVAGFVPPPGVPNPKIRYILIAEAALPLNPAVVGAEPEFGGQEGDKKNTYFYNVNHLGGTPYFREVRKAFNFPLGYIPAGITKPQVLWLLAQQGVLLLDLYPFAIKYTSKIRNALNAGGVSAHFWGNAPVALLAPETIGFRINALALEGILDPEGVKLAFMAPPKLMHFLAHQINLVALPNFGTIIRMGENATIPPVLPAPGHFIPGPLPPTFLVAPPPPASLVGLGGVVRPLGGVTRIPYYACACYDGAGNPNSLFIQNALLP